MTIESEQTRAREDAPPASKTLDRTTLLVLLGFFGGLGLLIALNMK